MLTAEKLLQQYKPEHSLLKQKIPKDSPWFICIDDSGTICAASFKPSHCKPRGFRVEKCRPLQEFLDNELLAMTLDDTYTERFKGNTAVLLAHFLDTLELTSMMRGDWNEKKYSEAAHKQNDQ